MGGFFKQIAKMGVMGAATAAGGPIGGAAVAGGLGALQGLQEGGTLKDMIMGGAQGAGGAYLGGQLAPTVPAISDPITTSINPSFNTITGQLENKSLLDALKFNY